MNFNVRERRDLNARMCKHVCLYEGGLRLCVRVCVYLFWGRIRGGN